MCHTQILNTKFTKVCFCNNRYGPTYFPYSCIRSAIISFFSNYDVSSIAHINLNKLPRAILFCRSVLSSSVPFTAIPMDQNRIIVCIRFHESICTGGDLEHRDTPGLFPSIMFTNSSHRMEEIPALCRVSLTAPL